MRRKKPNFKELTKHITARGKDLELLAPTHVPSKESSLRKQLITEGVLCKDCHRYLARVHYSVCKRCYDKRIQTLRKTGGVAVLTPKLMTKIEQDLRV